ncbi:MAG: hypothetical protein R2939_11385 [Kofleriaceae bacterium]
MRRSPLLLACCLLALPAGFSEGRLGVASASAAPKAKAGACGVAAMPLAVGNSWTFVPVPPPVEPSPAAKLFLPLQPKEVTITVTDVATAGAVTTVTLEENVDGTKIASTIVCGGGKFEIAPQSFLYAGEPGGWLDLEFSTWTSSGPSWVLTGSKFAPEWREDVKATWRRLGADKATGSLELERRVAIDGVEEVSTAAGQFKATRMIVELTGRVTLDKPVQAKAPIEMPANWINALWFADGVGPVQVLNAYAHMYSLDLELAQ